MRRAFSIILLTCAASLAAQGPWKLRLTCPQEKILLNIDLYEESITVPTMEDFGPMNGYMKAISMACGLSPRSASRTTTLPH